MVDFITGTVTEVRENLIILSVNGIGIQVGITSEGLFKIDSQVTVYIHMHWNAEMGPSLFGFLSVAERNIFVIMLGCSGIGPKIALALMGRLGVQGILHAVHGRDERALSAVPGIGPKKAEQLIVLLGHKREKLEESLAHEKGVSGQNTHVTGALRDTSQALETLGYSRAEITRAVQFVREHDQYAQGAGVDQLLRVALGYLAQRL